MMMMDSHVISRHMRIRRQKDFSSGMCTQGGPSFTVSLFKLHVEFEFFCKGRRTREPGEKPLEQG